MVVIKILECSSKGDKRFSAFGAKVKVFGVYDSIEFHYQLSKRFNDIDDPNLRGSWQNKMNYLRQVKGKQPDYIVIGGDKYDVKYLSQWYELLWMKYLDENKHLVEYATQFDDYNDMFKSKSINCQADVIRKYIKHGRDVIKEDCKELIELIKKNKTPKTKVVNKYAEEYDVYIGRGSKWGNPFTHKDGTKAEYRVNSREEAIEKYREWIMNQPELLKDLHELKGKTLGCFCKPKACHGDVLAELADKL